MALEKSGKLEATNLLLYIFLTLIPVWENPYKFPNQRWKVLNKPITKFYNGDGVNVILAELRLTKTRPTFFYKKHNLL